MTAQFRDTIAQSQTAFFVAAGGEQGSGRSTTLNQLITGDIAAQVPFPVGRNDGTTTRGCDFAGPFKLAELPLFHREGAIVPQTNPDIFFLDMEGLGSIGEVAGVRSAILRLTAVANVRFLQLQGTAKRRDIREIAEWLHGLTVGPHLLAAVPTWSPKTLLIARDAFDREPVALNRREDPMDQHNRRETYRIEQAVSQCDPGVDAKAFAFMGAPRCDSGEGLYRRYLEKMADQILSGVDSAPISGETFIGLFHAQMNLPRLIFGSGSGFGKIGPTPIPDDLIVPPRTDLVRWPVLTLAIVMVLIPLVVWAMRVLDGPSRGQS